MGMALPKLDTDHQFGISNLQAEKALPSKYAGIYETHRRHIELPRLHLWGLVGRWLSLPVSVRRVLSAALILAFVGSFYAVANIQLESAKEKIEVARSSQAALEDKLNEITAFPQAGFNSYSDFAARGLH